MKKIGITVEVRRRYYDEVEISDEQYEQLINGDIDELDIPEIDLAELFIKCRTESAYAAYEDSDYAITDEQGGIIVNWDN